MYNTQHLPENFEQCRLEKTILWHLILHSKWIALIQDGGKNHESVYQFHAAVTGMMFNEACRKVNSIR